MKVHAALRRVLVVVMSLIVTASVATACVVSVPELVGVRQFVTPLIGFPLSSPYLDASLDVVRVSERMLVGPHYRLGVGWTATGEQLSDRDAERLGTSAVRARAGEQLLIISIDSSRSLVSSLDANVLASIMIDDSSIELPNIFSLPSNVPQYGVSDSKIVILSTRPGADVRIQVTDSGRYSEMLLPSGEIVRSEDNYLRSSVDTEWDDEATFTEGRRTVVLKALGPLGSPGESTVRVVLTNYAEGQGWSPAGRAYLQVALPDFATPQYYSSELIFEDSDVLSYRPDASSSSIGALPAGRSVGVNGTVDDLIRRNFQFATFDIPQSEVVGQIELNLQRAMIFRGEELVNWVAPDDPLTLQVDFG